MGGALRAAPPPAVRRKTPEEAEEEAEVVPDSEAPAAAQTRRVPPLSAALSPAVLRVRPRLSSPVLQRDLSLLFYPVCGAMDPDKMDGNDWRYHGEGNKSLVVSHIQVSANPPSGGF